MCELSVLMGFLQDGSHVWLPLLVSFFIAGHRHLHRSVFLLYAVWIHDRRTLRVHWTANVTAATTTAKPFLLSVFLSGVFDMYTAQSYYRGGTGSVGGSLLGCEETPSACGQFLSCHLAGTLPCCLLSTARWQNGHLGLFYWWQRCPLISDRFICCRSRCRFTDVYRCWIPVSCWMSQSMVTIQFALLNVF